MANDGGGKGFLGGLFNKVKSGIDALAQQPTVPKPPEPRPSQNPSASYVRNTGPLTNTSSATGPLTAPVIRTPEELAEESELRQSFITAYLADPELVPEFRDPKYVYKIVSDERGYQGQQCAKLEEDLRFMLQTADPAFLVPLEDEAQVPEPDADDEPSPEVLEMRERAEAKREFQARRSALEAEIQKIRDFQTQLFLILKNVTGIKKKTGGTGFLNPPPGI